MKLLTSVAAGIDARSSAHVSDNVRVPHRNCSRAAFRNSRIMGDDQDGGLQILMQMANEVQDLGSSVAVEVTRGLIGKNDGRGTCQCTSDCHPLPLTSREFIRKVSDAMGELHRVQQLGCTLVDFRARKPLQVKRKGYIFQTGEGRQKIKELENKSNLLAAQASKVVIREPSHAFPIDADLAGCGPIQPTDQIEHRRFPGPGRPNDGNHFTALDLEIHLVERYNLAFTAITLRYACQ
jgi:hypothetical protein